MNILEVGDLVLVTKKTDTRISKGLVIWTDQMNQAIGNVYTVVAYHEPTSKWACLSYRNWLFPIESLKKIELSDKANTETFIDLIQV
jgi:hypothetical protein